MKLLHYTAMALRICCLVTAMLCLVGVCAHLSWLVLRWAFPPITFTPVLLVTLACALLLVWHDVRDRRERWSARLLVMLTEPSVDRDPFCFEAELSSACVPALSQYLLHHVSGNALPLLDYGHSRIEMEAGDLRGTLSPLVEAFGSRDSDTFRMYRLFRTRDGLLGWLDVLWGSTTSSLVGTMDGTTTMIAGGPGRCIAKKGPHVGPDGQCQWEGQTDISGQDVVRIDGARVHVFSSTRTKPPGILRLCQLLDELGSLSDDAMVMVECIRPAKAARNPWENVQPVLRATEI